MAQYRKEVTRALDECLDRILVNGESIEQCLKRYPALAGELAPLLKTALMTHRATALTPRPEFRERARFQFQAALRDMAVKREEKRGFGFRLSWQPRFATVAITIILALVVIGSGTVAAASNSFPDSPLYPVKLATETVQLQLADAPLEKAELHSKFADNRVAELVKMAEKGKPEQVEKLAKKLNSELVAMTLAAKANGEAGLMEAGKATPNLQAPMAAPALAPQIGAETVPEPAPEAPPTATPAPVAPKPVPAPTVKPAPMPAPKKVGPSAVAPAPVAPKATDKAPVVIAPAPTAATPQPLSPEQLAKLEKRAKLKMLMMQKADANPQAIRDALKDAPDSVKAALFQALTVADSGYQQALDALGTTASPPTALP